LATASLAAQTLSPNPIASVKTSTPTPTQAAVLPDDPAGNPQNQPVTQAIVVIAPEGSTRTSVQFYDCNTGSWVLKDEISGYVGKNGCTDDKHEGDGKTPKGIFYLGFAFGTEKPATGLDFKMITNESCWVDDPGSQYYNTWQEGNKGWKSAEKLYSSPTAYHYAVAVRYNVGCVPGKGSAIFLHCSMGKPTTGCVSISVDELKKWLGWLNKEDHPVIIVANTAQEAEQYRLVPNTILETNN
jgi:L,D-peptidoglycan transpeptidase YkuD (ErfK/YbiS/YcfS/YnhG family)